MKRLNALLATLVLAGLVLAGIGVRLTLEARSARSWPQVEGQVTESVVRGSGGNYWPAITYRYSVNGQPYTNSNLNRGQGYSAYSIRGNAAYVLREYPVGRVVSVHYDPADPARSYLLVGFAWASIMLLAMGIALTGLALALLVEFNRAARRRRVAASLKAQH